MATLISDDIKSNSDDRLSKAIVGGVKLIAAAMAIVFCIAMFSACLLCDEAEISAFLGSL